MINIKSSAQIEGIAQAGNILAQTLETVCAQVTPGITTQELDRIAYTTISALGGKPSFLGYRGYPATLCASVNETVIHGIPNAEPLPEGAIVGIDCGARYQGYWSDAARTVAVGSVTPVLDDLIAHTEEALQAGIAAALAGNHISDISRAIFAVAQRYQYAVVREYCGHGVGIALHEEPNVPNYVARGFDPRLRSGMVLAIEPMFCLGGEAIYVAQDGWAVVSRDHAPAAHWEHTVAITDSGPRILTVQLTVQPSV